MILIWNLILYQSLLSLALMGPVKKDLQSLSMVLPHSLPTVQSKVLKWETKKFVYAFLQLKT